jgi:hypothetical protein
VVGISRSAAWWAMRLPAPVPPVNEIFATAGCPVIASPMTALLPGRTVTSPSGSPDATTISINAMATRGVHSAGLRTTALPAARAGAIFCASEAIGEFHGVIAATTPNGSRTLTVSQGPRRGVTASWRDSTAAA